MNSIKLNDQVGKLPDIKEPSKRWGALKKEIFKRKNQDKPKETENKFSGETKVTTIQNENGETVNISEFSLAPMQKQHRAGHLANLVLKTIKSVSVSDSNQVPKRRQQESDPSKRSAIVLPNLRIPPPDDGQRSVRAATESVYNATSKFAGGESAQARYEPTYQTEPLKKFDRNQAEHIVNDELNSLVTSGRLDSTPLTMQSAVKTLMESVTTRIKSRIKEISDKRYKILVNCTLSEQKYQGIIIASKCLWDQRNDTCVTVKQTFKNHVILVNVFAIYHE